MLDSLPRAVLSVLASSSILSRLASRYGMRRPDSFARRFVAGETVAEAIAAARSAEQAGLGAILDYLGEHTTSTEAAAEATREYVMMLAEIERAGISRHVSIKLSQLGIEVDRATSIDNLRRVFEAAQTHRFFVRVDMEGSQYTAQTFEAFETLWGIGYRNVGIAVQAYLRRSAGDVDRANAMGASVRLVKGAYNEPRDVAFQHKAEVDASFVALMKALLERGARPAIATHDDAMIDETLRFAESRGIARDKYEFEMLYGVRRDLQSRLVAQGHTVNVYIPFGRQWFAYFMRRLGERPSNIGFVVKSLLREKV
jgi:proline dehydrogenase